MTTSTSEAERRKERKKQLHRARMVEYRKRHHGRLKKRVAVSFSQKEHDDLVADAMESGLTPAKHLKKCYEAFQNNSKVLPRELTDDVLQELLALRIAVVNTANNINQITHRMHLELKGLPVKPAFDPLKSRAAILEAEKLLWDFLTKYEPGI
ncbi:MAG: hypothetical protein HQL69_02530 [Magnetococcales bacterium]|nr:hypothetical protein [Magnetococcales bacterium]